MWGGEYSGSVSVDTIHRVMWGGEYCGSVSVDTIHRVMWGGEHCRYLSVPVDTIHCAMKAGVWLVL